MRKIATCFTVIGFAALGSGLLLPLTRNTGPVLAAGKYQPATIEFAPTKPAQFFPIHPKVEVAPGLAQAPTRPRSRPASNAAAKLRALENAPRLFSDDDFALSQWPEHSKNQPRVTLILNADQQVHILPANSPLVAAQGLAGPQGLLITAETFQLTPSTEPGVGNQIRCSGSVEIHNAQFTGTGSQLMIHRGELVLTGTKDNLAVLTKVAAPAPQTEEPQTPPAPIPPRSAPEQVEYDTSDRSRTFPPETNVGTPPGAPPALPVATPSAPIATPEFRISAQQIKFTLTLDRLQLGQGTEITPSAPLAAPVAPPLPIPVELNGAGSA